MSFPLPKLDIEALRSTFKIYVTVSVFYRVSTTKVKLLHNLIAYAIFAEVQLQWLSLRSLGRPLGIFLKNTHSKHNGH